MSGGVGLGAGVAFGSSSGGRLATRGGRGSDYLSASNDDWEDYSGKIGSMSGTAGTLPESSYFLWRMKPVGAEPSRTPT
jgi:hypothetical protein